MNQIEKLQNANKAAKLIIAGFIATAEATPDVIAARTEELDKMSKKDLVALVLQLEKPKVDKSVKVEDVVKALLTAPECAIFNYETIASLVVQAIPDAKTSQKTVASYASKKNEEWGVIKRERFQIDPTEYMKLVTENEEHRHAANG